MLKDAALAGCRLDSTFSCLRGSTLSTRIHPHEEKDFAVDLLCCICGGH